MTASFVVCLAVVALVPGAAAATDINNVQVRYNRAALARTFAIGGAAADAVAVAVTHGFTFAASVAEIVYAVAAAVLVMSLVGIDMQRVGEKVALNGPCS